MASVSFISFKTMKLLYNDFAGARADEIIECLAQNLSMVQSQAPGLVYMLSDIEGARYNSSLLKVLKEVMKENSPYVAASAVCGLDKIDKVVVNSVLSYAGRQVKGFDNLEEAKDYLWTVNELRKQEEFQARLNGFTSPLDNRLNA